MTVRRNLTLAAILAGIFFSCSAQAESWVPTATKATRVASTAHTTRTHLAAMHAGTPLHVVVALKWRNRSELDALTSGLIRGGQRAHPISAAEFTRRFAPTDAQVEAVVAHLRKSGFTHIVVSPNRMLVSADGSAGAANLAFHTELHTFNVNGRLAHANVTDAAVPQALADTVLAVHGLQTVHLHHTMAQPLARRLATGGHNPTEFAAIYNAAGLPSATNATIGIITQGDMTQTVTDLQNFAAGAGYPNVPVSTITVGAASSDTAGVGEWNMDTQDALAAAGGTINQMLLYTATTLSDADLTNTYNKAVSDNLAKTINVSLGECENDAQASGVMASNDQIFQNAVAQGQTFSVSSGDSGAYECGGPGTSQSYPSVSPYVMSIGGTRLDTAGTTWQNESVWSCTDATSCQHNAGGGAGGGPSLTEAAPAWQSNAGVLGNSRMRGTPDVSLDADPASGALVLVNGATQQIGGTSLAAPLFTGFWARVQSMHNNALGFPASAMYAQAAANPDMFHDVTSGSNGGYAARSGWDFASGFGSLNMDRFAAVMGGDTPPPTDAGLGNGVPVNGIALATGDSRTFTFNVPAGASNLRISTAGVSGDCDLYVQIGGTASTSSYLQKSDGPTTNESITIASPAAGTYSILVYGYDAPSGVTLTASYDGGNGARRKAAVPARSTLPPGLTVLPAAGTRSR
ncbi:MAG: protease pro-enzyme activation domain-containing protein [Pseudomonadota bacterium]|nr:protease pro-enzyme activation domain-containing protein [Pseudomonadota bacterium]